MSGRKFRSPGELLDALRIPVESPTTLHEVGGWYLAQVRNARKRADREQMHEMGLGLWRIVANRSATDRARHVVQSTAYFDITARWLDRHGYRSSTVGHTFTSAGLLLGRAGEPAVLAREGDVLLWDGQHVTLEGGGA